jgi:outer membrane lipoprotein SlyB
MPHALPTLPLPKLALLALLLPLAACGPDYSPNTYSSTAVQQAAKVEQGVVVGVRRVAVSPQGATGAVAGAAAGAAVGSQVPAGGGVSSTLGAIGGSLLGGLVGAGTEKAMGETQAWEYVVRKPSGEMISVTQIDDPPLALGTKVLVIAGSQARIVADYTVPPATPAAPAAVTPAAPTPLPLPTLGATQEPEPARKPAEQPVSGTD